MTRTDSGERIRLLLAERARVLARRPPSAPEGQRLQVLAFRAGGERYGIDLRFVASVVRVARPTPLPGAAAPFADVITHRGEVLAVFDVPALLGGSPAEKPAGPSIVVVTDPSYEVADLGLRADALDDVVEILPDALLELPPGPAASSGRARGVTADALTLLDGARLLVDPTLSLGEGGPTGRPER